MKYMCVDCGSVIESDGFCFIDKRKVCEKCYDNFVRRSGVNKSDNKETTTEFYSKLPEAPPPSPRVDK